MCHFNKKKYNIFVLGKDTRLNNFDQRWNMVNCCLWRKINVSLAAFYRKVFFVHFLQSRMKKRNVKKDIRKASVELWGAKFPQSAISS
jgi:hypothetical protein